MSSKWEKSLTKVPIAQNVILVVLASYVIWACFSKTHFLKATFSGHEFMLFYAFKIAISIVFVFKML